jgi:hypothetical protein
MNEERVKACHRMLEHACREAAVQMTGDARIGEADAATLLGYAPGHLKNLRQSGKGPACYGRGLNGGRLSYRLEDLAEWIEASRQD